MRFQDDPEISEPTTLNPEEIFENLGQLDGSPASAVAFLGGISVEDLEEYGGVPKCEEHN